MNTTADRRTVEHSTLTATQRRLRARAAAAARWAQTVDRSAATQPARDALATKHETEVDPTGALAPDERARRADDARRAHMLSIAQRAHR